MEQDARTDLILDSAQHLFEHKGIKGTTMNDIANGAGLGKPVIYQFFTSKDEILEAVIQREINRLMAFVSAGINEIDNPIIKLAKLWDNSILFYEKDEFLMHIMRGNELGLPPYLYDRTVLGIETFVVNMIETLFQEAMDKGLFVRFNSRLAAYISYRIYQAGTYGRTETVKGYTSRHILKRVIEIMGVGLISQQVDVKSVLEAAAAFEDDTPEPEQEKKPIT